MARHHARPRGGAAVAAAPAGGAAAVATPAPAVAAAPAVPATPVVAAAPAGGAAAVATPAPAGGGAAVATPAPAGGAAAVATPAPAASGAPTTPVSHGASWLWMIGGILVLLAILAVLTIGVIVLWNWAMGPSKQPTPTHQTTPRGPNAYSEPFIAPRYEARQEGQATIHWGKDFKENLDPHAQQQPQSPTPDK